jgi:hypothetical protein
MKSQSRWLCLLAALAWVAWCGGTTPTSAAEEDRGGRAERLDRLERRLDELAQHQEQIMRRLSALPEHQGPVPGPGQEHFGHPMLAPGAPAPPSAKVLHDLAGAVHLILLGCILCNILLAVWIFTDIRKRGEGPGIFIALALVAGVPAAIIYAIVRIGDKKA